ncbi:DNA-binding transcriptional LysR family regulator [Variovorax sp. 54]|uniref:LysR family transcriptional regulator n=1 Tax=Variovorax sp. 54 TaxID=2035212 RepID=UPI000C18D72B|nr:LysR family transcriptional regulator [Variovorax sp. 54]PIF77803.1 DNA-binding transcriptional LysR family regulator [Variovorax sp. 54]
MKVLSDQLDGFLLRLLVAVVEEKSVSRAAHRLNLPQSTVSAGLTRLRAIFNDPLLVRGRNSMVPTDRMVTLYDRLRGLSEEMEALCATRSETEPTEITREFHIGAMDYVSSRFIPDIIARLLREMPHASIHIHPLPLDVDYQEDLENGVLDLVIGNSAMPAENLHLYPLFEDEIVCLVRQGHPLLRTGVTQAAYLEADHLGLIPVNANQLGVIDAYLAQVGLRRRVKVVLPYFNNVPNLLAQSDLVFTTCRRFAQAHAEGSPLQIVAAPIDFPAMRFHLLWHERTHRSVACRQMRELVAGAIGRSTASPPAGDGPSSASTP